MNMFHEIKGQNVTFDRAKQTASWSPFSTGGCAFTKKHLYPGEPLKLTLNGSGGIELGVVSTDPAHIQQHPIITSKMPGYQFLNDVKIHKRSCSMTIKIDTKSKEVTSTYGGGNYIQALKGGEKYWMVVDVKYGLVEWQVENSSNGNVHQEFSDVHGYNVSIFNDPTCAKTVLKSPAAMCFFKEPVKKGQVFSLQCSPKSHQGTIPGRYYIGIKYMAIGPENLKHQYPNLFDIAAKSNRSDKPKWKEIENFEKEEFSGGPITLEFSGEEVKYHAASGKSSSQPCALNNAGIWLAFELYGVSVKVDTKMGSSDESVTDGAAMTRPKLQHSESESTVEVSNRRIPSIAEETVDGFGPPRARIRSGSPTGEATAAISNMQMSSRNKPVRNVDDAVNLERAIRSNWSYLLDSFCAKDFLDCMFEKDLVNMNKMEEIRRKAGKEANREVLLIFITRPMSKKFMVHSLERTGQAFLIDRFFPPEDNEKE